MSEIYMHTRPSNIHTKTSAIEMFPYFHNTIFHQLLLSKCLLLLLLTMTNCNPPDPINCSSETSKCTITNAVGLFPDRTICKAACAAYPTSEQELVWIVSNATKANTKMKVATRFSHSFPKLVCPDGHDGLLISTKYFNRVVGIDKKAKTMTVESGVTLKEVIEEAAKAGLALTQAPYWWGLTVGGMLSTGAHGSTLWGRGTGVHDYVIEMRMVTPSGAEDGYAKVRILKEGDELLDAARVSLGVLGVISQVTLKLEPLFKRSITFETTNDEDIADKVVSFGEEHEFGDIVWYPSQRKAVYRIDDRISSDKPGNGLYDFIPFRPQLSTALTLRRASEELEESISDGAGKCLSGIVVSTTLRTSAFGLTNDGILFTKYPVIGYHNRLQSSGRCIDSPDILNLTTCFWDPSIRGDVYFNTGISVSISMAKSFIKDVKKLVQLKLDAFCGLELYGGLLIRYVKASKAYLGKEEDSIEFDMTYYRSRDPMMPRLYEDVFEEIEQMAVFKYGGLPHWGKNRNIVFEGVVGKYKKAKGFLKVKDMFDPLGVFSSEWTDQILGLRNGVSIVKEGCALEGLCICSVDIHCAPHKGYFCKNGKVYEDARVCRHTSNF